MLGFPRCVFFIKNCKNCQGALADLTSVIGTSVDKFRVCFLQQKKGTTLLKETEKYFEKFMIYVTIYMY